VTTPLDEPDLRRLLEDAARPSSPSFRADEVLHRGRRIRLRRRVTAVMSGLAVVAAAVAIPTSFLPDLVPLIGDDRAGPAGPAPDAADDAAPEPGHRCPDPIGTGWRCFGSDRPSPPDRALPPPAEEHASAVDLVSLEGQVVVVSAWADWCPPCRSQPADAESVATRFPGGVAVVSIATATTEDAARAFRRSEQLQNVPLLDFDGRYLAALTRAANPEDPGAQGGLPATFVLDGDGRIAAAAWGQVDEDDVLAAVVYAAD